MSETYIHDWEKLAAIDAEFAVLSDGAKRFGAWSREEFYQSGDDEISEFFDDLKRFGIPTQFHSALDFGCGLGRLSRALHKHIPRVVGVDVSPTMVARSTEAFAAMDGLKFQLNQSGRLETFADASFDLVFSLITLQHIPKLEWVQTFLAEFVRVLKPDGVLYFQFPSAELYPTWKKPLLQARGWAFHRLVTLGVPEQVCYRQLRVEPFMSMTYTSVAQMQAFFKKLGCECTLVRESHTTTKTKYIVRKLPS
jgi:SAM-dependent methyltransferase